MSPLFTREMVDPRESKGFLPEDLSIIRIPPQGRADFPREVMDTPCLYHAGCKCYETIFPCTIPVLTVAALYDLVREYRKDDVRHFRVLKGLLDEPFVHKELVPGWRLFFQKPIPGSDRCRNLDSQLGLLKAGSDVPTAEEETVKMVFYYLKYGNFPALGMSARTSTGSDDLRIIVGARDIGRGAELHICCGYPNDRYDLDGRVGLAACRTIPS